MDRRYPNARTILSRIETDLAGYPLIPTPQTDDCRVTFLVPVYNEHPRRLLRLLDSLAGQYLPPGIEIEATAVVNNKPDDKTAEWRSAFETNQLLLQILNDRATNRATWHHLPIHAIDMSSPGLALPGSNVGTARQRGLLEAAIRYAERGVNGLVVHTDADCWFDDPRFVYKIVHLFNNPSVLALGGASTMVYDPSDPECAAVQDLELYRLYRMFLGLARDIREGSIKQTRVDETLGRCIVHRAFEGVLAGGFPPIAYLEDAHFCTALKAFGSAHDMTFELGSKWGLGPSTAFRVSDRTPSGIRRRLQKLDGEQVMVRDWRSDDPNARTPLTEKYVNQLAAIVATMPRGPERIEYLRFHKPDMRIRVERSTP
jgi:hypothetical protein